MVSSKEQVAMLDSIYGLIIGDAIGVPAEFKSREQLAEHPVKGMTGWGSHNQPPGTWSDDTSMVLATIDSINTCGLNWDDMMEKFNDWYQHDKYTPHGVVFDIGITTSSSLSRYRAGVPALDCGGADRLSNGNGSLMRILPVVLYCRNMSPVNLILAVHKASSLTHRHPISLVGCGIYALIAVNLLKGVKPSIAITAGYNTAASLYSKTYPDAFKEYSKIERLSKLTEDEISGSGYIVDTLIASLWCVLKSKTYRQAVLTSVNLGKDTDTVGAVTGSLAGMIHLIPVDWKKKLQNQYLLNKYISEFMFTLT